METKIRTSGRHYRSRHKNIITKISLIFIFFVIYKYNPAIAQSNIALSQEADTVKLIKYYQSAVYYKDTNEDSALYFIKKMLSVANKLFSKYQKDTAKFHNYLSFVKRAYRKSEKMYYYLEKFDLLLKLSNQEIKIAKYLKDSLWLGAIYSNMGNVYKFQSNFGTALAYYQKYLDIRKQSNNLKGVMYAHIGIANVFINWDKYSEALKHYKISYKYAAKLKDTIGLASANIGMGNVYIEEGDIPLALLSYKKAYNFYKAKKDTEGIGLALLNIGNIYTDTKEYEKATTTFKEALALMLKANIKIRIALIYSQLGEISYLQKKYSEAITYYNKSLNYSLETNYRKVTLVDYQGLAKSYNKLKKYHKAYIFFEKFHNLNDSIFNEEKHKQLEEIQTQYETAQKEKEILKQKNLLEKEKAQREAQRKQLRLLSVILLGSVIFIIFIIRSYTQNKKTNKILAFQKAQIENSHKEISQSIDYATKIQKVVLPDFKIMETYCQDYFVLFQPRDKVSGDFYWWSHTGNHTVITVADCTGHGVPGAFMSMLGMSLLREIVTKEQITQPGKILNRLRQEIIKALKQKGAEGEQKDGMDMALISIDHQKSRISYAGANNPLYLVSSYNHHFSSNDRTQIFSSHSNLTLYEIKPDKMPIAIYQKMTNFVSVEFERIEGDCIYLFSDGYADQFGGPKGKKFKYKPFKELLLANANKPMSEQQKIVAQTLTQWKQKYEQVDDITVVGIKI